jgi:hypothetical protein
VEHRLVIEIPRYSRNKHAAMGAMADAGERYGAQY